MRNQPESSSPPHEHHIGPLERTVDEVESFHGHIGPFVTLGLRMGSAAMKDLGAEAYFGVHVTAICPPKTPQSCLLDGLQLSTGATLGKQNIKLVPGEGIRVEITDKNTGRRLVLEPTEDLLAQLEAWSSQGIPVPERARELSKWSDEDLFVCLKE